MVVRLLGGVFLIAWASGEIARPSFTLWAGTVDLLIGATALPLAWWVSTGPHLAVAAAIVWNALGLLDFAVAVAISRTRPAAGPGPLLVLNTPAVTALKPTILGILSWGVPVAIITHILSLWQLTT
jgi:hypothetical protein